MGFSEMQKQGHISELQRYLHDISYYDPNIPRIIPDGIYGTETADAVRRFQRQYGLNDNGEANPATWLAIVDVYRSFVENLAESLDIFPREIGKIIAQGDDGLPVLVIQSILRTLAQKYPNIPPVEITGEYDEATAQAVREFQKITGLPQTGTVDRATWNLLAAVTAAELNP